LLTLPLKKSAFGYNISITVSASLDSIAAVANCCAAPHPGLISLTGT
jgi:hypothetical protein